MSQAASCPKCGAPAQGLLCRFCGLLLESAEEPEAQLKALDEYHAAIGKADAEAQKRLLTSGFIPDSPQGLIEAGVMCIPLCRDADTGVSDAAANRLEAILLKLELVRETAETRKAMDRFRQAIKDQRRKASSETWLGCTMFTVLAAILIALAAYLIHRFTR